MRKMGSQQKNDKTEKATGTRGTVEKQDRTLKRLTLQNVIKDSGHAYLEI